MAGELPVSVLLLARDETAGVAALLAALADAREAVVVWDPAGDPAVREAAAAAGARVFERPLDGFGAQRAFALERCTQPWVLWVDADEMPDAMLRAALPRALAEAGETTAFTVLRRGWFLGRPIRHCGWRGERIVRLFRRAHARFDDAPVHERVIVAGPPPAPLPGVLEHRSYETWEACVDKMVRYARAGAEAARRAGRRSGPLDVLARPPLRFLRMYVAQLGVLDGAHGLVLCALAAAQVFLKYAELWARPRGGAGRA
uniref:Glycosyltransferase family 2 protein n=1 Tax=Eiseniibacteriota bacterium TaxID=2212470 RepID=A0A832MKY3_UNCEI